MSRARSRARRASSARAGDEVLDPVDGAGVDEHPPDRLDALELEVVAAEEALDDLALGVVDAASRACATRTVRLPSRRSSPAGLPVGLGVAEDAQQVVAQLERLAEREAVVGQARERAVRCAADERHR